MFGKNQIPVSLPWAVGREDRSPFVPCLLPELP